MNENNASNNNFEHQNKPPIKEVNSNQNQPRGNYPPPPPPYGQPPHGHHPHNQPFHPQHNHGYESSVLLSVKKLASTYIWLYFLSVLLWFIAIATAIIGVSSSSVGISALSLVLILIGVIFALVNFIIAIVLAVKTSNLNDKYGGQFMAPFILFIVGIFINLCGIIASFITLSKIKRIRNNYAPSYQPYGEPPHQGPYSKPY